MLGTRPLFALVLLALLWTPRPTRAAPTNARVFGSHSMPFQLSLDPGQLAALQEARLQRKHRRARRVLTAGVAISASALLHAVWAGSVRNACFGDPERRGLHTASLMAAGGAGAVGISLTFVGAFRLAATRSDSPLSTTRKERAILGLLGVGSAAVTQLLLGIVRLGDNGFCAR
jgi:hypothetical protein